MRAPFSAEPSGRKSPGHILSINKWLSLCTAAVVPASPSRSAIARPVHATRPSPAPRCRQRTRHRTTSSSDHAPLRARHIRPHARLTPSCASARGPAIGGNSRSFQAVRARRRDEREHAIIGRSRRFRQLASLS